MNKKICNLVLSLLIMFTCGFVFVACGDNTTPNTTYYTITVPSGEGYSVRVSNATSENGELKVASDTKPNVVISINQGYELDNLFVLMYGGNYYPKSSFLVGDSSYSIDLAKPTSDGAITFSTGGVSRKQATLNLPSVEHVSFSVEKVLRYSTTLTDDDSARQELNYISGTTKLYYGDKLAIKATVDTGYTITNTEYGRNCSIDLISSSTSDIGPSSLRTKYYNGSWYFVTSNITTDLTLSLSTGSAVALNTYNLESSSKENYNDYSIYLYYSDTSVTLFEEHSYAPTDFDIDKLTFAVSTSTQSHTYTDVNKNVFNINGDLSVYEIVTGAGNVGLTFGTDIKLENGEYQYYDGSNWYTLTIIPSTISELEGTATKSLYISCCHDSIRTPLTACSGSDYSFVLDGKTYYKYELSKSQFTTLHANCSDPIFRYMLSLDTISNINYLANKEIEVYLWDSEKYVEQVENVDYIAEDGQNVYLDPFMDANDNGTKDTDEQYIYIANESVASAYSICYKTIDGVTGYFYSDGNYWYALNQDSTVQNKFACTINTTFYIDGTDMMGTYFIDLNGNGTNDTGDISLSYNTGINLNINNIKYEGSKYYWSDNTKWFELTHVTGNKYTLTQNIVVLWKEAEATNVASSQNLYILNDGKFVKIIATQLNEKTLDEQTLYYLIDDNSYIVCGATDGHYYEVDTANSTSEETNYKVATVLSLDGTYYVLNNSIYHKLKLLQLNYVLSSINPSPDYEKATGVTGDDNKITIVNTETGANIYVNAGDVNKLVNTLYTKSSKVVRVYVDIPEETEYTNVQITLVALNDANMYNIYSGIEKSYGNHVTFELATDLWARPLVESTSNRHYVDINLMDIYTLCGSYVDSSCVTGFAFVVALV